MENPCENGLAVASVCQEMTFIKTALGEWQSLDIAERSLESQTEAVKTILAIFSSFLVEPEHKSSAVIDDMSSDRLRVVLSGLVAVAGATARSGLAQAWVHSGLAHRDRIDLVWRLDRYSKLSDFTKATIRSLDDRIMALDRQSVPTTLN